MTNPATAIKSMKLYSSVDRIFNELRMFSKVDDDALDVADLVPFDQYRYHGTDAVDKAVQLLNMGPETRIIEVGAGIGGPARYLAHKSCCSEEGMTLIHKKR